VAPEVAELEPSLFDAVTLTRNRCPTSELPAVYRRFVAAAIAPHAPPAELQRSHWYANEVGAFRQLPL
jgi:hypothetical protein